MYNYRVKSGIHSVVYIRCKNSISMANNRITVEDTLFLDDRYLGGSR
jgi:hypothetical protein